MMLGSREDCIVNLAGTITRGRQERDKLISDHFANLQWLVRIHINMTLR